MPPYVREHLLKVSQQFRIYGQLLHAELCKIGHINETYTATYDQGGVLVRYIHQKINKNVFRDPVAVMENIMRVTTHLLNKLRQNGAHQITRRVLTVIPTHDGLPYYVDEYGDYWRTFVCVEKVHSLEVAETLEHAFEAGRAFGEFQTLLSDLPGERLHVTIPDFHNACKRLDTLKAVIEADPVGRVKDAKEEIAFAREQEPWVRNLMDAFEKEKIPERITHNDTKFNNVLLDWETGKAMCVVDLDTVMAGRVHYDFGDLVRSTTSPTREDDTNLEAVKVQIPMFEALTRGYLSEAKKFLTPQEKKFLHVAGRLMTFTLGVRFLTDYLQGDTYFRVHRPQHNLDRCRNQFALVRSLIEHEQEMEDIVRRVWKEI